MDRPRTPPRPDRPVPGSPAGPVVPPGSAAPAPVPSAPRLTRSPERGVVGGVAAGLARHLGVGVTTVRVVLVLLGALSGSGVVAYAALWALTPAAPPEAQGPPVDPAERRRGRLLAAGGAVLAVGTVAVLTATGLNVLIPVLVAAVGAVVVWRESDRGSRAAHTSVTAWARISAGVALVVVGLAVVVLGQVRFAALRSSLLAVLVTLLGVGLLSVPLWMRLWRSLEAERSARVREAERAHIASHLHDSVLQTLALIQRRADEPDQVARLARRQERELRQWLFGDPATASAGPDVATAVRLLCGEIEDVHGLRVDQVVVGGDRPVDEAEDAVLGAVREALVNVAKHAGVETADVFVEIEGEPGPGVDPSSTDVEATLTAFVRDRGRGFDPEAVPPDRHGLEHSVRRRVRDRGGEVTVRSTPGRGTEVGIRMPLGGRVGEPR